jgi:hypothetical protein
MSQLPFRVVIPHDPEQSHSACRQRHAAARGRNERHQRASTSLRIRILTEHSRGDDGLEPVSTGQLVGRPIGARDRRWRFATAHRATVHFVDATSADTSERWQEVSADERPTFRSPE